jgi:hypothetical protein
LTQDSKASPFTRLLFVLKPWYALEPGQLDGVRVATVADPLAVSRAWALQLLADGSDSRPPWPPAAPPWVRDFVPWLGRYWGEEPNRARPPGIHAAVFEWARSNPGGLRAAAQALAARRTGEAPPEPDAEARLLLEILRRFDKPDAPGGGFSDRLLKARPQALVEAVEIVIRHPDAVRSVLTHPGYTDPAAIGGFLDRDLPGPQERGANTSAGRASVPSRSASTCSGRIGPTTTRASSSARAAIAQASQ